MFLICVFYICGWHKRQTGFFKNLFSFFHLSCKRLLYNLSRLNRFWVLMCFIRRNVIDIYLILDALYIWHYNALVNVLYDNSVSPVNLAACFINCGRKHEHPVETHSGKTIRSHKERTKTAPCWDQTQGLFVVEQQRYPLCRLSDF